jgi:hypothetical protein
MNQLIDKAKIYALATGKFILYRVLPWGVALDLVIGLSFFIWPGFSYTALSERLVWTGVALFLVSSFLIYAQTAGGRDFGVPGAFMNSAHAAVLHDWNIEIRKDIERRFDFRIQLFLIGLFLFLSGVLAQVLSS